MNAIAKLMLLLSLTAISFAQTPVQGTSSIDGSVLDSNGNPYPAQVQVLGIVIRQGIGDLYPKCFTVTHQEGRFLCPHLPAGRYIVQAIPLLMPTRSGSHDAPALPASIFYPNVTDLDAASVISLHDGEEELANFQLQNVPVSDVSGTLADHTPSAAIHLDAVGGGRSIDTRLRVRYDTSNGQFSTGRVAPGHYLLTADWFIDGAEHKAAYPFLVGDTAVGNIHLSSLSNTEIDGRLTNLPENNSITEVRLERVDAAFRDITARVEAGAFHFHPVPAGDYILALPSGAPVYVSSLDVGGKSISGPAFTLVSGQPALSITAQLQSSSLAIQGTVDRWDGDAPKAEIIALNEDSRQIFEGVTDSNLRFSITGVPPGTYRLFAWPGVDSVEYRSLGLLKRYEQDSIEVSLETGTPAGQVELKPIEKER
jgi:hypothetical protein